MVDRKEKGRERKIGGHEAELVFHKLFGDRRKGMSLDSEPSADCEVVDRELFRVLKNKLGVGGPSVSLKRGKTIQIYLAWIPELTKRKVWTENLRKTEEGYTTSDHGKSFEEQKKVLKSKSFWNKYLRKGDTLCYLDDGDSCWRWVFFDMDDVIDFITSELSWRLLPTGRIKGDYNNRSGIVTYEYRKRKDQFVLGFHTDSKGEEFIGLLAESAKVPSVAVSTDIREIGDLPPSLIESLTKGGRAESSVYLLRKSGSLLLFEDPHDPQESFLEKNHSRKLDKFL